MGATMMQARKGQLAVKAPQFIKLEAKTHGDAAFATIANKTDLILVDLVLDYDLDGSHLHAGVDQVILQGDCGLQIWAKKSYNIAGKEFVLCPESAVLGFSKKLPASPSAKDSHSYGSGTAS